MRAYVLADNSSKKDTSYFDLFSIVNFSFENDAAGGDSDSDNTFNLLNTNRQH